MVALFAFLVAACIATGTAILAIGMGKGYTLGQIGHLALLTWRRFFWPRKGEPPWYDTGRDEQL